MVENTENKVTYQVGSSPVYAFPIRFIDPSDIHCFLNTDGTERELLAIDFTVEAKDDYSHGANVTLNISPLPVGATLVILRQCSPKQLVSFPVNGKFPSKGNEAALDRITMILQDLYEIIRRAVISPVTMTSYSYDYLLNLITQNTALATAARSIAQELATRFAPLTVNEGDLFWQNCLVYTECNHECDCDCDTPDPEPETPVTPPAETPRGHVVAHRYNRRLQIRLFGDMPLEDTDTCTTDSYVLSVGYNWNSTTAEKAYESSRYYGKYASLEGYDEEGCVYDSDPLDCTSQEYLDARSGAANAAWNDIRIFFEGGFEVQQPSDRPPVDGPWTGFKNYIRREFFGGPTDVELTDIDDELAVYTQTSTDWFSSWGESPCTTGDGFCTVVLTTVVFEWVPDTGYTGPAPSFVTLESSNQVLDCYFNREYCLTGRMDINEGFYGLTTCQGDNVEVCGFVILRGTVNGDGEFEKQESKVDRTYKFKGVTL